MAWTSRRFSAAAFLGEIAFSNKALIEGPLVGPTAVVDQAPDCRFSESPAWSIEPFAYVLHRFTVRRISSLTSGSEPLIAIAGLNSDAGIFRHICSAHSAILVDPINDIRRVDG